VLDAIVGFVVVLLVGAGILVMVGPRALAQRVRSLPQFNGVHNLFEQRRPREVVAPGLNPKTQRVLVAAARLANWMRAHGHEDVARDIRNAAARINGNEPAGLYALQTTLRRIRVVNITDTPSQERLKALIGELRTAVQDRFEQLELLPFRKP
jgi:hypothetical protein